MRSSSSLSQALLYSLYHISLTMFAGTASQWTSLSLSTKTHLLVLILESSDLTLSLDQSQELRIVYQAIVLICEN